MGNRVRVAARVALWVAWGTALLLLPSCLRWCFDSALSAAGGRAAPPLSLYLWTAGIPLAAVGAALAWAFRDLLERRKRALVAAGLVALLVELALAVAHGLWLSSVTPALLAALAWGERALRWVSWSLWGAALPAWALPGAPTAAPASPLEGLSGTDALSERERAVAEALVTGSSVAQVSEAFGVSPSTVATYRSRACEKLGVASLDELVPKELGAAATPAPFDVTSPAALSLMALSLGAGCALRLLVRAGLLSGGLFDRAGGLLVVTALLAAPWGALLGYARARGMRVRARAVASRLALVMATLAVLGLLVGGGSRGPSVSLGGSDVSLGVLGLVVHAAAVAVLAPYLLWSGQCEAKELDVERSVLYLRGRGAGELQARVLVEIALGRSMPEVCEALSVARGTVNAYRAQGYELLGVHSSRELADLLARDVGLVPSADKKAPSADDFETSA